MVNVSSFTLDYNKVKKYFSIKSSEESHCPLCGGELKYRDSVFRNVKNILSDVRRFLLRRLRCQTKGCRKLHRELPDIIQPYKHYESEVIQAAIDGSEDAGKCSADNRTIRRWKSEFANAKADIEQRLASLYTQTTEELVPLGASSMFLDGIKSKHSRWLPFVMGLLINNGHKICTEFAFCPASSSSKMALDSKNKSLGGENDVKTIKDTS
jgi:hypothetical protein